MPKENDLDKSEEEEKKSLKMASKLKGDITIHPSISLSSSAKYILSTDK